MMRLSLCLVAGLLFASVPVSAQEADFPAKLVDFLKPGMHVGIRTQEDSGIMRFSVYTDADFAIAKDSQRLGLDELAAKYDTVSEMRAERMRQAVERHESSGDDAELGTDVEVRLTLVPDRFSLFCTIVHVGDDYVLVSFGKDELRRRALTTANISQINWHDGGLTINSSIRRVAKQTTVR